jgi:hypothetical protein
MAWSSMGWAEMGWVGSNWTRLVRGVGKGSDGLGGGTWSEDDGVQRGEKIRACKPIARVGPGNGSRRTQYDPAPTLTPTQLRRDRWPVRAPRGTPGAGRPGTGRRVQACLARAVSGAQCNDAGLRPLVRFDWACIVVFARYGFSKADELQAWLIPGVARRARNPADPRSAFADFCAASIVLHLFAYNFLG